MITKYKTTRWHNIIEKVSVLRETEKCVYVADWHGSGSRREAKISDHYRYSDTWKEAHANLLEVAKQKVDFARRELEVANSKYEDVKGMKAPS